MSFETLDQSNKATQPPIQQTQRLSLPSEYWLTLEAGLENNLAGWAAHQTEETLHTETGNPNEEARQRLADLSQIEGFSDLIKE